MLSKAPSENMVPERGEPDNKNWFVYRVLHFCSLARFAWVRIVQKGASLHQPIDSCHAVVIHFRNILARLSLSIRSNNAFRSNSNLSLTVIPDRLQERITICVYQSAPRCTLRVMNPIKIAPGGKFSLGDENFLIEVAVPLKDRRPSTAEAFTIVKNEPYLRVYEDLASGFSPRSILELGIFQGGSYVFLDKLFKPRRMSAVDIRAEACCAAFGLCLSYPRIGLFTLVHCSATTRC